MDQINPLTVLKARRLTFLAPHLDPIEIKIQDWGAFNKIPQWIEHNLKGRYFYGDITKLNDDNRIITCKVVAFEDQYESSMFLLKCPHIGQK